MSLKELFIPKKRIVIKNDQERNNYINIYNGKKNLYETVYTYEDQCDIFHVNVDKIFLDFDVDDDMKFFKDVKTIAEYFYKNSYKFYIRFSGRGFHIFVMIDDTYLTNPKQAIKSYVKDLHKKTNTKSDRAVVGDLRRVVRIPGTVNMKSNLYCIPITYEELMTKTYDEICQIAKKSRINFDRVIGSEKLNISEWDGEQKVTTERVQRVTTNTTVSNDIPKCIKNLMSDPSMGYRERFMFIIFFRELGYTEEEIEDLLKETLNDEKFYHCIEEENQVSYLIDRMDLFFPSCNSIKIDGLCPDDKCEGCNLYY